LEILASWIFHLNLLNEELNLFKKLARFKPEREINVGLTSVPTFYLDRFSQDLTWLAKHGGLPIALGRREDLSEIFKLMSEGKKNIIIKGSEGSGRTAIINELAYKMVTEQVPQVWEDKRLVKLEVSGILGNPQKCEEALVQALKEANHAGNIVLTSSKTMGLSSLEPPRLQITPIICKRHRISQKCLQLTS
jgi:ATP-dependent Clp protease ATP-binding subunit ClpA